MKLKNISVKLDYKMENIKQEIKHDFYKSVNEILIYNVTQIRNDPAYEVYFEFSPQNGGWHSIRNSVFGKWNNWIEW